MSTPISRPTPSANGPVPSPQTGTWRHPQFDEIARRQNASNFSDRNVRKIVYNFGGLMTIWMLGRVLWESLPNFLLPGKVLDPYAWYAYYFIKLAFAINIVVALVPLFRRADDLSDIPLTPGQRKLLGLPPTSAPPTPGSPYATPPRYARSSATLGGSAGSKGSYTESPLSGKGSPLSGSLSGSPFSSVGPPMLQKALGPGMEGLRRHSYGTPSPLGPGAPRPYIPETPGTPSPTTAKVSSVGLNNRWLYEKGRRNSGNKIYS